jgi:hypothetical protein
MEGLQNFLAPLVGLWAVHNAIFYSAGGGYPLDASDRYMLWVQRLGNVISQSGIRPGSPGRTLCQGASRTNERLPF